MAAGKKRESIPATMKRALELATSSAYPPSESWSPDEFPEVIQRALSYAIEDEGMVDGETVYSVVRPATLRSRRVPSPLSPRAFLTAIGDRGLSLAEILDIPPNALRNFYVMHRRSAKRQLENELAVREGVDRLTEQLGSIRSSIMAVVDVVELLDFESAFDARDAAETYAHLRSIESYLAARLNAYQPRAGRKADEELARFVTDWLARFGDARDSYELCALVASVTFGREFDPESIRRGRGRRNR